MQSKTGKFITIEGVEGVGKSTNIGFINDMLQSNKIATVITREPGGTAFGEALRTVLLQDHIAEIDPVAELMLIFAARAQHLRQVIRPALARGDWVLCDRFTDATYAYQGGGRGIDRQKIASLEALVQEGLQPDLTLILDLDPAIGLQRAAKRGNLDRIEKEQLQFFQRVRDSYLQNAASNSRRCVVINAAASLEQVQRDVREAVDKLLSGV